MVNINKLKGKIVENGFNVTELAEQIGIDKATFYRKLSSGGDTFTIKEASSIAKALNLNLDEVNTIFLNQIVA